MNDYVIMVYVNGMTPYIYSEWEEDVHLISRQEARTLADSLSSQWPNAQFKLFKLVPEEGE